MVQIDVTHSNLKQYCMELRLDLHTKIGDVKRKLYTHSGTALPYMTLVLKESGPDGAVIRTMDDDDKPLGYYGVRNGNVIHVVDNDPMSLSRGGGLDDVSQVQKYRMTDEDYDKREKTLRAFKKKQLELDPGFKFLPENRRPPPVDPTPYLVEECVAGISPGLRCKLNPGGRRGTVRWVGSGVASLAPGFWVGVQLDEPVGLGNGSRGGVAYFECGDMYGSFVRPDKLDCGDFPPEFDESEFGVTADGSAIAEAAASATPSVDPGVSAASSTVYSAPLPQASAAAASAASKSKPKRRGQDDGDDDNDDEL
jgi:tubulin-specific chaperone B